MYFQHFTGDIFLWSFTGFSMFHFIYTSLYTSCGQSCIFCTIIETVEDNKQSDGFCQAPGADAVLVLIMLQFVDTAFKTRTSFTFQNKGQTNTHNPLYFRCKGIEASCKGARVSDSHYCTNFHHANESPDARRWKEGKT